MQQTRRRAVLLLIAGGFLLFGAHPALGADPYSGGTTGTLSGDGGTSDNPSKPGDRVTVTACGYHGNVNFSFNGSSIGSATAGSDGCAVLSFTVPNANAGCSNTVVTSGTDATTNGPRSSTGAFCVAAATASLAFTGADHVWRDVGIGGALIVLGTGLVLAFRRRRRPGLAA